MLTAKTTDKDWMINWALRESFSCKWAKAPKGSPASKWAGSDYQAFVKHWRKAVSQMVESFDNLIHFKAAWLSSELRTTSEQWCIKRFGAGKVLWL
jgi:hypothetical protein